MSELPDEDEVADLRRDIDRLSRELAESSRRLETIERAMSVGRTPVPEPAAEPLVPREAPGPSSTRMAEEAPEESHGLERRVGLTWVNRIGAITLILGIAFFFKYAIENQWIGETARVLLGALAGLLTIGAGEAFWRRDQKIFAQGITGAGAAILYLSFFAAFGFYHVWPQAVVFCLLALTTAAAGALAMRYSAMAIAALALFGGYAAPVLLSDGSDHPWILFSYVALLSAGALWLSQRERWPLPQAIGGAGTAFLYFAWLLPGRRGEELAATLFLAVFYAMFARLRPFAYFAATQLLAAWAVFAIWYENHPAFVLCALILTVAGLAIGDRFEFAGSPPAVLFGCCFLFAAWRLGAGSIDPNELSLQLVLVLAWLGILVAWIPWKLRVRRRPLLAPDLFTLGAAGIFSFAALYTELSPRHHEVLGLTTALLAVVYLGIGYALRTEEGARLISLATAVVFITLAIPIQFAGYTIAMSWALEGALLMWLGERFDLTHAKLVALGVLGLSLGHLCLVDFGMFQGDRKFALIWNARFATGAVVASCLLFSASIIKDRVPKLSTWGAGHGALLIALELEVLEWATRSSPPDTVTNLQSAATSILFAVYAVILVASGLVRRVRASRIAGLALMGIVIFKLYLYDVWQLTRIYRVVAFVALGALLMGASYAYSRWRGELGELWKRE